MVVRVASVGGQVKEVNLNAGATVNDALRAAGLSNQNAKEIRLNSEKAEGTTPVRDNDVVLLVPRVEGGR